MSLGLYFGSDDLLNYDSNRAAVAAARAFLLKFEGTFGSLQCRDIQDLMLGHYFDPREGKAGAEAFAAAKGFEKCSVVGGIGARLAAEIIIDSMKA